MATTFFYNISSLKVNIFSNVLFITLAFFDKNKKGGFY